MIPTAVKTAVAGVTKVVRVRSAAAKVETAKAIKELHDLQAQRGNLGGLMTALGRQGKRAGGAYMEGGRIARQKAGLVGAAAYHTALPGLGFAVYQETGAGKYGKQEAAQEISPQELQDRVRAYLGRQDVAEEALKANVEQLRQMRDTRGVSVMDQVRAGRRLPVGAVRIGGTDRHDLLDDLALAMTEMAEARDRSNSGLMSLVESSEMLNSLPPMGSV